MNNGYLIDEYRGRTFDRDPNDPLYGNPQALRWLTEGQLEACRRSTMIIDAMTPEICTVAYDTVQPAIRRDARIIYIREAIVEGQAFPLDEVLQDRMNEICPTWRTDTAQFPMRYIKDFSSGYIRLHPKPTVAGRVLLSVVREPLVILDKLTGDPGSGGAPEIEGRYQFGLINWMIYRTFSQKDPDVQDLARASQGLRDFELEFGKRKSALTEKWINEQSGRMPDTLVY